MVSGVISNSRIDNESLLVWAINNNDIETLRLLFSLGVKNVTGQAFHEAVFRGDITIVKEVVRAGIAISIKYDGKSALERAKEMELQDIVDYLVQVGAGNQPETSQGVDTGTSLPIATDFVLQDINGDNVRLSDLNGKVRLLQFFFSYCPDVCPPTTYLLPQVQEELKKDGVFGTETEIISVTIDPDRDTSERLLEYAQQFDADFDGWRFLRGREKAIAELAANYNVMVTKDEEGNFGHMNLLVIIDKEGNISEWINANDYILNGDKNKKASDIVNKFKELLL